MASRSHREEVLRREREALARGPLSHEEEVEYDCQRAWEMAKAEARRRPSPQLELEAA